MVLWAQTSTLSENRVISTKIAEIRKKLGTYLFLICKITFQTSDIYFKLQVHQKCSFQNTIHQLPTKL